MSCLCHGRFQEFPSCRHIIEKLMDQERSPVGGSGLFDRDLFSSLDHIAGPQFCICSLCDHLCSGHRSDTGERLAAEPQRCDMRQVLHTLDLARGMAQKGAADFRSRNPAAVVHDPDQRDPAVFDLHLHRSGACVDGILHQFFHNGGRAFYHFTGSDLIDRDLVKYLNMGHICLLFMYYHLFFSLF